MSFDEYREILDAEIAPTLSALARAKELVSVSKEPSLFMTSGDDIEEVEPDEIDFQML